MFSSETPNYGLPKYAPLDHPDFLTDFNNAFKKIDEALFDNKTQGLDVKEEVDAIAVRLDDVEQLANTLQARVNELVSLEDNETFIALKTQVEGLATEVSTAKKVIGNNKSTITATRNALDAVSLRVDAVETKVADLQHEMTEHDNTFTAINSALEQLRSSTGRIDTKLLIVETQSDKNAQDIIATRQEVAEYHGNVTTLESEVSTLRTQVTSNTGRVTQVEKNIVKNNTTTGSLKTEVESLKVSDTALNNRVTTMDDRLVALEQGSGGSGETVTNEALNAVLNRVSNLESTTTAQQALITTANSKGVENAGRIDGLETGLANVEADITENDTAITTLTQTVSELQAKDIVIEGNVTAADTKAQGALDGLATLRTNTEADHTKLETVEEVVNVHTTDIANNKVEIQSVKNALEEVSGTGGELTGLTGRTSALEEKVQTLENNDTVQDQMIQANADAIASTRGNGFTSAMTNVALKSLIDSKPSTAGVTLPLTTGNINFPSSDYTDGYTTTMYNTGNGTNTNKGSGGKPVLLLKEMSRITVSISVGTIEYPETYTVKLDLYGLNGTVLYSQSVTKAYTNSFNEVGITIGDITTIVIPVISITRNGTPSGGSYKCIARLNKITNGLRLA